MFVSPLNHESDQGSVESADPGIACNRTRPCLASDESIIQKSPCRAKEYRQCMSGEEINHLRPEEFHSEIPPLMFTAVNPTFFRRAAADKLLLPD